MITLLIISILLVVSFIGTAIWVKRELPESVSAMVYDMPQAGQWFWIVWLWASTFTLIPALFETMPEEWGVIAYAFATSMLFVGAMPLIKDSANRMHYVLAVSGGIFSQLCVVIIYPQWLTAWLLFPFLLGSIYIQPQGWLAKAVANKGVFIAECICYVSVVGSILIMW